MRAGPRLGRPSCVSWAGALETHRTGTYTWDVGIPPLPLFPLPLVLFPGTPLPLHIFEPRYRRMLADCLDGDGRFGILYQAEGAGETEPAAGSVGCVARIDSCEALPDGRSNVIVSGVARFELERIVRAQAPYLVGSVRDYDDLAEPAAPLESLARQVRDVFARVGRAARALTDDSNAVPELPPDPALLSFAIASLVDLDVAARQALLLSRSPIERLRRMDTLLTSAVETIELRADVHRRAKGNGHGPQPAA